MIGKVLPVFHDRLVLEELFVTRLDQEMLSSCVLNAYTHLIDILLSPDELLPLPTSEHAKLGTDEANLASASPSQRGGSTKRHEFLEFLDHMQQSCVRSGFTEISVPQKAFTYN